MSADPKHLDIWSLVWGSPHIDPELLISAIEEQLTQPKWDERTKILIRESTNALREHLGKDRINKWIAGNQNSERLLRLQSEDLGKAGFPFLKDRLMNRTNPDTVMQFLRELGLRCLSNSRLEIGGSIALLLKGYLSRSTEDIDIVDEIPEEIRIQRDLIDELQKRYGLALTHFQSHYLPEGWKNRLDHLGTFGSLDVFLVDPYDLFVYKLFSSRTKDLDDLRVLNAHIDKSNLVEHFKKFGKVLAKEEKLRNSAENNWYILFGENLPG
jgi:hypothetical protein